MMGMCASAVRLMLDAPAWRCRISLSLSLSSASALAEEVPRRAQSRCLCFVPAGGGLSASRVGASHAHGWGVSLMSASARVSAAGDCRFASFLGRAARAARADSFGAGEGHAAGPGGGDAAFAVVGGGGGGDRRGGL